MGSPFSFSILRGDYSFRTLFFIIVFVQVLVSSVLTAQFYLIQHESSSEFTVIKSFPVATITSCVLECSASSNICDKTEIEIKDNGQKVCHLLQTKPREESKVLSKENPSESAGNGIKNERSFILSPIQKEEAVYMVGWVLQKQNLCYDATNYSLKSGLFQASQPGIVTQVKLVHVQGFVQINQKSLKSYWGDVSQEEDCAKDNCFGTLVINATRNIIFPYNTTFNRNNNFNLKGFTDPNSTFITMSRESNPYIVGKDEEFQIILGSQLKHGKDYDAGSHCVDVHFKYEKEKSVNIKGWVLQKPNVCYDNKNELKTKWFKATQAGNVTQVRLVHVNGFVQGLKGSLKVYWGDAGPSADCAKDKCFGTLIVNSKNEMIFPGNIPMTAYYNFNLEGFTDPKSTFIAMSRGTLNPYMVERDQEFQVILGAKFSKEDFTYYAGQHCVDVYFYFD